MVDADGRERQRPRWGAARASRARKKSARAPSVSEPRVKWYGLPIEAMPATAPASVRRRRVADEAAERVTDDPDAPAAREGLHLFDRAGRSSRT